MCVKPITKPQSWELVSNTELIDGLSDYAKSLIAEAEKQMCGVVAIANRTRREWWKSR